jgi:hypothetical protein
MPSHRQLLGSCFSGCYFPLIDANNAMVGAARITQLDRSAKYGLFTLSGHDPITGRVAYQPV